MPDSQVSERRWYGWQGLAVDGGAVVLGLTSIALLSKDDPYGSEGRERFATMLGVVGAVGYGVGAPTFHLVHHRPWQALGSFALRGGLPVVGGALGMSLATCPPPTGDYGNCGLPELLMGAAAGALVAVALDASLLAWETRPREERGQARFGVVPVLASEGRRELRVFATF
ncbi:MAG TPA: hypothetical protein VEQ58_05580 [Polyangiaceae bacterium]|nr:hypothetical protein [Polyangiaceae bacterium]